MGQVTGSIFDYQFLFQKGGALNRSLGVHAGRSRLRCSFFAFFLHFFCILFWRGGLWFGKMNSLRLIGGRRKRRAHYELEPSCEIIRHPQHALIRPNGPAPNANSFN